MGTVDARSVAAVNQDSTATWWQAGRPYYRVRVIKDGVYHLSNSVLQSYGIDLSVLNNSTAAVYYLGQAQPNRIHTDSIAANSFIEFYAHRNHGPNSYFNRYDDTSSYWLTWNDPSPFRSIDAAPASSPRDTTAWYIEDQWNEQDLNYFFGVTTDDLLTTDNVPGEGWYWTHFLPGQSRTLIFTTDSVQRKTGIPVQFRARFNGMTECSGGGCLYPSRHRALLTVNRVSVGSIDFTQNNSAIFSGTFSDSILHKGNDTLIVSSYRLDPAGFEHLQILPRLVRGEIPRPLLGLNGVLHFTTSAPAAAGSHAFKVNGIPADSASIYDLTDGRRITGLTKTGTTTFLFADTLSVPREFIIVKDAAKLLPPRSSGNNLPICGIAPAARITSSSRTRSSFSRRTSSRNSGHRKTGFARR